MLGVVGADKKDLEFKVISGANNILKKKFKACRLNKDMTCKNYIDMGPQGINTANKFFSKLPYFPGFDNSTFLQPVELIRYRIVRKSGLNHPKFNRLIRETATLVGGTLKFKKRFHLIAFVSLVYAQVTSAPFGTGGAQNSPPIGTKLSGSDCLTKGCLEFVVKPSCFGTNLRAYDASLQMKEDEDDVIKFTMQNPSDSSKKDILKIQYPAKLTFDTEGVRRSCSVTGSGSLKSLICQKPGGGGTLGYSLSGWKLDKNPSCYANGGYKGQEYCDYAGVVLGANLVSGSFEDTSINCIYIFDDANKVDDSKISCLIQSQVQDRSDQVSASFNSMSLSSVVHHGKLQPVSPASVNIEFSQISAGSGTQRTISSLVERSGFDEVNGNRSYTLIVKHPGVEGFCGGFYSPLMLFFDGKFPKFNGMSLFPLYRMKPGQRVNWPEKYANGFEALKIHDKNKDGIINKKDSIFKTLKLWNDKNGNGISDENELVSLSSKGVISINLKYNSKNPSKFGRRARAREKSSFNFRENGEKSKGEIFDVWLAPIQE